MGKRKGRKQRSDQGTAKTRKKQTPPPAAVEKQRKKPGNTEQPVRHPRPRVPPPDSKLWPEEYRDRTSAVIKAVQALDAGVARELAGR